jgi:predicted O-methyltransferase YrrM
MNPVLAEILTTSLVKSADGNVLKLHSNISREQGEFLQKVILESQPKVSLEIGLAYGISALFICEALNQIPGTRHIIIDPYQSTSWREIGLDNLKKAGYEEIIELHQQLSHLALPQMELQGTKIDFAFIDGMHTFDHTLIDFFYIDRMLNVGGIIAIDDANWPSIRKVCRFIVTNRSYSVFRCLDHHDAKLSFNRQMLKRAANTSKAVRRILKPEYIQPDIELGLKPFTRCIAFKKEADDKRKWDFHREF